MTDHTRQLIVGTGRRSAGDEVSQLIDDSLLFLRLAGTRSGVSGSHIPWSVIATVVHLGGRVQFEAGRIFVCNARKTISVLREIRGRPQLS